MRLNCFWEHTKTNLVGSHGSWDDSAICICYNGEYRVRGGGEQGISSACSYQWPGC